MPTIELTIKSGNKQILTYDLFLSGREPKPSVLFLHGFGTDKSSIRGHAIRLSTLCNINVVTPNMIPWYSGADDPNNTTQLLNIESMSLLVEWMQTQSWCLRNKIILMGHSAGGALIFETACALADNDINVFCVVLLDAAPFPRTLSKSNNFHQEKTHLISIRADPSFMNKNAAVLQLMKNVNAKKELEKNKKKVDTKMCLSYHLEGTRHLDVFDPITGCQRAFLGPFVGGGFSHQSNEKKVGKLLDSLLMEVLVILEGELEEVKEIEAKEFIFKDTPSLAEIVREIGNVSQDVLV